ncbi:MAG TPA: choline kinase family protein [Povalibacter sp.]|nr:choline kinase family protein [Povalibacter sp.]
MSPAEVVAALPGLDAGSIQAIERIKHGLTNDSWLARTAQGTFVIRQSNTSEASLQIDRASEALILDTVARVGLGPEVIRNDLTRHLLVTRYVGPHWTDLQAVDPANINRIAMVLRRLHRLAAPAGVRRVDLLSVTERYLQTLDEHGANPAILAPALRKRAVEIAAALQHQSSECLCHNDIHALNVVDNGELRLIDWEYAGLGERFFDLASLCVYHAFSREQREQLLISYAGDYDPQTWHRLELCCWLFDYIRDLWMAVRALE